MKIVCVIPARIGSTRFPRKILAKIHGKTLLEHVWIQANKCLEFSEIYFAIDDEEVAKEIDRFNGVYKMTSKSCPTGTDRLIDFIEKSGVDGDVFVNWQADEPLISPQMIQDLLKNVYNPLEMVWTLKKIATMDEVLNPNVVKVVTDNFGRALYFSRSPIPYDRDQEGITYFKHIGLYAYRKEALLQIKKIKTSFLARVEKLEQLAFLENGIDICVLTTELQSQGVDTEEDLHKVISLISGN